MRKPSAAEIGKDTPPTVSRWTVQVRLSNLAQNLSYIVDVTTALASRLRYSWQLEKNRPARSSNWSGTMRGLSNLGTHIEKDCSRWFWLIVLVGWLVGWRLCRILGALKFPPSAHCSLYETIVRPRGVHASAWMTSSYHLAYLPNRTFTHPWTGQIGLSASGSGLEAWKKPKTLLPF